MSTRENAAILLAMAAIAFSGWTGSELKAASRIIRENQEIRGVRERQLEAEITAIRSELAAARAARRQTVSTRWENRKQSNVWSELSTPREIDESGKVEELETFIGRHSDAYRKAQEFGG